MVDIESLRFYGTSTMLFDSQNKEAILLIACDGSLNILVIRFGIIEGQLAGRASQMLLEEPFIAASTEVEVQEIDNSSNDLILRALGGDEEAEIKIIELFAENLALMAYEVIACHVDSNMLPTSAQ